MTSFRSFLFVGMTLSTLCLATAAQSSPIASFRVAEANSCRGWFATCVSRCSSRKELTCDKAFCTAKLETCRQTGCFTEGAHFGNASHCGLAK